MSVKIEVCERQIIKGLTNKQWNTLIDYTTVDNPKYIAAMKYSKWGAPKRIPKYLYYYDKTKDGDLVIPRGVDVERVLGEECEYTNLCVYNQVEYPKFKLTLREEQVLAMQAYNKSYQLRKTPQSVIHLPTAKGKTILALYIAQSYRAKTLVLVHKNDLVDGWNDDIKLAFGGEVESGLIKGKVRRIGEQITIATVQTLANYKDEDFEKLTNIFDLVIQDEVHHCAASTFTIVDLFKAQFRLGLSATPHRKDGLDCCLEYFYGGLCYEYEYKDYDEDICSVEVRLRQSRFKFNPILVSEKKGVAKYTLYNYYDFDKLPDEWKFLSDIEYAKRPRISSMTIDGIMMKNRDYRRQVLNDIYKEYMQGHSIIALFLQKEYIDLYYNSLIEYVPENEVIKYYGDSEEEDAVLRAKAESGEARITLATLAKATEGTNVKRWEVLFFVSSIASENNVEQAVGRVRRRREGKLEPVRVYDYQTNAYSLRNHATARIETYEKLKCRLFNTAHNDAFSRGYRYN